jgi:hypothetical protein
MIFELIEIILTAIIITAFALTTGWFIRRFHITRVHLGVLWVLGFALMLSREGILFACGIIILCFASGGFMYYWFFLGVEPTAPLERDRLIIDKHRDETAKRKTVEEHDRVIMDKYRENTKIMEYTKVHHLNKIEDVDAKEALEVLLSELEAKSSATQKYFYNNIAAIKNGNKWLHIKVQPASFLLVIYGTFNADDLKAFQKVSASARLESYGINLKIEKPSQIEELLKLIL